MKILREEMEEFKKLYKQHSGKEISDQKTYNHASTLLRLIELLL